MLETFSFQMELILKPSSIKQVGEELLKWVLSEHIMECQEDQPSIGWQKTFSSLVFYDTCWSYSIELYLAAINPHPA